MFIYFKSHLFLSASAGLPTTLQNYYMLFWTIIINSQLLLLDKPPLPFLFSFLLFIHVVLFTWIIIPHHIHLVMTNYLTLLLHCQDQPRLPLQCIWMLPISALKWTQDAKLDWIVSFSKRNAVKSWYFLAVPLLETD